MKNLFYYFTISILIYSCNSDDINNNSFYNLDTNLSFKVSSIDGTDLLNPNNQNVYLEENIKIYYLNENDEVVEIYNSNADSPRNFSITSPENSDVNFYIFGVGLNVQGERTETEPSFYNINNAITYIEWNEADTDTIKANFRSGDNFLKLSKAWYNEQLIFDEDMTYNEDNFPEVIKN
mgnify:CR=1 FL=1